MASAGFVEVLLVVGSGDAALFCGAPPVCVEKLSLHPSPDPLDEYIVKVVADGSKAQAEPVGA